MDQAEKDLINDFKDLFASDRGKRVLAAISQKCGYDESFAMPCQQESPQEVGFLLGMREATLYIKCQIARDPDAQQQTQIEDQGITLD